MDTHRFSTARPGKIRLFVLLALLFPGVSWGAGPCENEDSAARANTLVNVARFVEWPAGTFTSETEAVTIGVLGHNSLGEALEHLPGGKSINGRSIRVLSLTSPENATACHVLYVCPSETRHIPAVLGTIRGHPVLTVGESEGFAAQGGMVNLVAANGEIRFEINRAAAQRAGLSLSSKLLQLGTPVREQESEPRP